MHTPLSFRRLQARSDKRTEVRRLRLNGSCCVEGNGIAANEDHIAVLWEGRSADSLLILAVQDLFVEENADSENCGSNSNAPGVKVHTATRNLSEWQFSPFVSSSSLLMTAGEAEEGNLRLWSVPPATKGGQINQPTAVFSGHRRKTTAMCFNYLCEELLASGGTDRTVKIWNINQSKGVNPESSPLSTTEVNGVVASLAWKFRGGNLLAIASRDSSQSFLSLIDARKKTVVESFGSHCTGRHPRTCFLDGQAGRERLLVTTGYGTSGHGEYKLWDTANMAKPLDEGSLAAGVSSAFQPYWDETTGLLLTNAKGSNNVRAHCIDQSSFSKLAPVKDLPLCFGKEQHRGLAFFPKCTVDSSASEILRAVNVVDTSVLRKSSFVLERKVGGQTCASPICFSGLSAVSCENWLGGGVTVDEMEPTRMAMAGRPAGCRTAAGRQKLSAAQRRHRSAGPPPAATKPSSPPVLRQLRPVSNPDSSAVNLPPVAVDPTSAIQFPPITKQAPAPVTAPMANAAASAMTPGSSRRAMQAAAVTFPPPRAPSTQRDGSNKPSARLSAPSAVSGEQYAANVTAAHEEAVVRSSGRRAGQNLPQRPRGSHSSLPPPTVASAAHSRTAVTAKVPRLQLPLQDGATRKLASPACSEPFTDEDGGRSLYCPSPPASPPLSPPSPQSPAMSSSPTPRRHVPPAEVAEEAPRGRGASFLSRGISGAASSLMNLFTGGTASKDSYDEWIAQFALSQAEAQSRRKWLGEAPPTAADVRPVVVPREQATAPEPPALPLAQRSAVADEPPAEPLDLSSPPPRRGLAFQTVNAQRLELSLPPPIPTLSSQYSAPPPGASFVPASAVPGELPRVSRRSTLCTVSSTTRHTRPESDASRNVSPMSPDCNAVRPVTEGRPPGLPPPYTTGKPPVRASTSDSAVALGVPPRHLQPSLIPHPSPSRRLRSTPTATLSPTSTTSASEFRRRSPAAALATRSEAERQPLGPPGSANRVRVGKVVWEDGVCENLVHFPHQSTISLYGQRREPPLPLTPGATARSAAVPSSRIPLGRRMTGGTTSSGNASPRSARSGVPSPPRTDVVSRFRLVHTMQRKPRTGLSARDSSAPPPGSDCSGLPPSAVADYQSRRRFAAPRRVAQQKSNASSTTTGTAVSSYGV